MPKQVTEEDLKLLGELGLNIEREQSRQYLPEEERVIAGFEDIERFVDVQGKLPQHGENRGIFERIYAVRLDQLKNSKKWREFLKPFDSQGLLNAKLDLDKSLDTDKELTDEALLETLGAEAVPDNDIIQLTHVRPHQEINAAEEIAQRSPCNDFNKFKPIFESVQLELEAGKRQTSKYQNNANINQGDMFVLEGQKVIVADIGEQFVSTYGRPDRRLRVVYDNGTESDLLLRSLQRALNKDKNSRRITKTDMGPLFSAIEEDDDLQTGYIYVLRSKSDNPFISEHRLIIHKIGVTNGDVEKRISSAKKDPTYLLADVEVVATFKLANINRKKLEGLLQKFFSSVRLDLELKDRFNLPVKPKEWFLVPLNVIEETIGKIYDGTIDSFQYDPKSARLLRI